MDYKHYFQDKPPPVFQEFAIAICELLLEREWPADVTQAITDVLAAVRSGDKADIHRAAADAARVARAAYAAADAARAAARAARAARAAAHAAHAAADTAHAAPHTALSAADAAHAAAYAQMALPAQKDRVHAIVLMIT